MLSVFWMVSALAVPAEDMACEMIRVEQTLPADGASDVPLNAGFRLLFSPGCDGPSAWTVTLTAADEPVEQVQVNGGYEVADADVLVAFAAPFEADTDYVVLVVPNGGWGEPLSVAFTTGAANAVALSGAPAILSLDSEVANPEPGWWAGMIHFEASTLADASGLSVLRVLDVNDNPIKGEYGVSGAEVSGSFFWTQEENEEGEGCFKVIQENAAGAVSPVSEVVCVALEAGPAAKRCAHTSGGLGWLSLGLLAVFGRRR